MQTTPSYIIDHIRVELLIGEGFATVASPHSHPLWLLTCFALLLSLQLAYSLCQYSRTTTTLFDEEHQIAFASLISGLVGAIVGGLLFSVSIPTPHNASSIHTLVAIVGLSLFATRILTRFFYSLSLMEVALTSLFFTSVIIPFCSQILWSTTGLPTLGFTDYGGATLVHGCALGGALALGLLLPVQKNLSRRQLTEQRPEVAAVGGFAFLGGWLGIILLFADPALHHIDVLILTTILGGFGGALTILLLTLSRWTFSQSSLAIPTSYGTLAGLIAITPGCPYLSPLGALMVGSIGAGVMILSFPLAQRLALAAHHQRLLSAHGSPLLWGLCIGALVTPHAGVDQMPLIFIQLTGYFATIGVSFVLMSFFVIAARGLLRTQSRYDAHPVLLWLSFFDACEREAQTPHQLDADISEPNATSELIDAFENEDMPDPIANASQEVKAYFGTMAKAIQHTIKDLKQANDVKSQFLANMSHELRTPLNGIIGSLELSLEDKKLSEETTVYLQTALDSSYSLLEIIGDLLDFTAIARGRITIVPQVIDTREVFRHLFDRFSLRAKREALNYGYTLAPELPYEISLDFQHLSQALFNVLSNALKFTPSGGTISVNVSTDEGNEKEETMLHIEVKDTGVGIAKDKLKEVFKPFHQLDNSVTKTHGGTGIGLAISAELIELMKGALTCESEVNKGTTFTVSVPVTIVTLERNSVPIEASSESTSEAETTQESKSEARTFQRLLLADDDPTSQEVLKFMLLSRGYDVTCVSDGQEVVTYATQETYDLILMDCQMPQLSGFQATELIRNFENDHNRTSVPIIGLSANVTDDWNVKALAQGMNYFLSKPVTIDQLFDAIHQVEQQSRSLEQTKK